MGLGKYDSVAVLEGLAPDVGWVTDVAIVSTYSLDLVAAAALVTALAGEGEDHEAMKKSALARACERMRDRFRIVCQGGRVAVPRAGHKALVLADRWVRTVNHDGNSRSWHAKLAFVRYSKGAEVAWRLWLGSRNLTRDTSWDSAVIAVGKKDGSQGPETPGVARAAAAIAERAELTNWPAARIREELSSIRWAWPKDVLSVESFVLWPDGDPAPGFPEAPASVKTIVAVGPFIDASTCSRVATWGGEAPLRSLLSVQPTLARLAATKTAKLAVFGDLYAMESAPPADAPEPEASDADQMPEPQRGLHAKLLWCRAADGDHLWLGSANLTARAWGGLNTEAVAHLRVAPDVGAALVDEVVKPCSRLTLEELAGPAEDDERQKALDSQRNQIAAGWGGRLKRLSDGTFLLSSSPCPLPTGAEAVLACRMVGSPDLVSWVAGQETVILPPVRAHEETELVELHLMLVGEPVAKAAWVARAPLDPPPTLERDRAVLSRLMGPRAFLLWLCQLINEVVGDDDEAWPPRDFERGTTGRLSARARREAFPSLESVLRAWSRDQAAIARLDRAVQTWAAQVQAHPPEDASPEETQALRQLDQFLAQWVVLRQGLGLEGRTP
jgi:hypothetical protein